MGGWMKFVRALLLAASAALSLSLFLGSAVPAGAQYNDERRRGDLSSIPLPGGGVVEFKSLESQTLRTTQPYSILLPPSYAKSPQRAYPVVYFLHGLNNDQTSWTVDRYGNLATDNTVANGTPFHLALTGNARFANGTSELDGALANGQFTTTITDTVVEDISIAITPPPTGAVHTCAWVETSTANTLDALAA